MLLICFVNCCIYLFTLFVIIIILFIISKYYFRITIPYSLIKLVFANCNPKKTREMPFSIYHRRSSLAWIGISAAHPPVPSARVPFLLKRNLQKTLEISLVEEKRNILTEILGYTKNFYRNSFFISWKENDVCLIYKSDWN